MLVPGFFGEDLFDEMFGTPARRDYYERQNTAAGDFMRTDIREDGGNYIMDIDLPGFRKEDIKLHLKDGYLTIEASRAEDKEAKGKYIRRERYMGHGSRSFFVGKRITHEDVHAKFENGILQLVFPKEETKQEIEHNKYITIEG